jgi:hypothetical protein
MELRKYLRNDFSKYIRNKLIKDKCEYCGEMNDLHLHHVDMFAELLNETLDELDLKELDTHDYSNKELMLIKNVMLGKQMKIEYVTLCKDCHTKVHDDIDKNNYYNPYGSYIQLNIQELNKLNLDYQLIPKFIKIACHIDYENKIVFSYSGNKKRFSNDYYDLIELLNISESHYYHKVKDQLIDNNLIYLKDDVLVVNDKYIIKGYCSNENNIKIFCDSYIDLYNMCDLKEFKLLGKVIVNLDKVDYDNVLNYNYTYFALHILNMKTTKRTRESINSRDNILIEKDNVLYLNPKYFYKGILNSKLKIINDNFNTINLD